MDGTKSRRKRTGSRDSKSGFKDADLEQDGLFLSRRIQDNISQSRLSSCFAKPADTKPVAASASGTSKANAPPGYPNSKSSPTAGTSENRGCYTCGEFGHFSYTCPLKGREFSTPQPQQPNLALKTRLTDAEKEECRRLKKCYTCGEFGHPYFRCPQEEKRLSAINAERDSKSSTKLWRDSCWLYKTANGQSQGPFSLLRLCSKLQDGAISGFIEVSHLHARVGPIALGKLMDYADNGTLATMLNALPDSSVSKLDAKLVRERLMDVVRTKLHTEVLETTGRLLFSSVINESLQEWMTLKKPFRRPETEQYPSCPPATEFYPPSRAAEVSLEAQPELYPEVYEQSPIYEAEPPPPGCDDASAPSVSAPTFAFVKPVTSTTLSLQESVSSTAVSLQTPVTSTAVSLQTPVTSTAVSLQKPVTSTAIVASPLQSVQERLHHAVIEAARKSILDVVVGQYLQSWTLNNEMRKKAAQDEKAKALLENDSVQTHLEVQSDAITKREAEVPEDSAEDGHVNSTPRRRNSKKETEEKQNSEKRRKRKPSAESKDEELPSKRIARKRLVKVAHTEPAADPDSVLLESPRKSNDKSPSEDKTSPSATEEPEPTIPKFTKRKAKDEKESPAKRRPRKRSVSFVDTEQKERAEPDDSEPVAAKDVQSESVEKKVKAGKQKDVQCVKRADTRTKQVRRRVGGEKPELKKNVNQESSVDAIPKDVPDSKGCARCYIDGSKWREWSRRAKQRQRAVVTSMELQEADEGNTSLRAARKNRAQFRNMAEVMKVSQMARKKRLKFQRSQIHAWGLVAAERIEAEDLVVEYVGEVVRSRISDLREERYEKSGLDSSYFFRIDSEYVVDATKRGGIARFINHSCDPNCYPKILTVDGQKRIFIYSKKVIQPGVELTYDYKFPLEENKVPCYCGAARCRKFMN